MKFSDLPEDSWEKVMIRVVDFIGGESAALCNWSDEIPTPEKVAEEIISMCAYFQDIESERYVNAFNKYSDHKGVKNEI